MSRLKQCLRPGELASAHDTRRSHGTDPNGIYVCGRPSKESECDELFDFSDHAETRVPVSIHLVLWAISDGVCLASFYTGRPGVYL